MIKRWLKVSYLIVAVGLLFAQYASAVQTDDNLMVLFRLGYFAPVPPEPQLSSDEKTLYNGGLPVVYVDNPDPFHEPVRIPAPLGLLSLPEFATATFSITYVPNGDTDPWAEPCYTFPNEAKAAFNAAANIWGNIIKSSVPITIRACWADLGESSILGYSGGGPLRRDFTGAPRVNTWYGGSLANALAGSDLDPSSFDMHITYNLNFSWYYGTDGITPAGQHDLMTVVLHEIAHGLNFSGSMSYSGGQGSWGYGTGYPNIYDTFTRDGTGNELINTGVYANPSTALGTALTSNNIWFHGTNAMAANGGFRVKMYAPGTWSSGSSYSHLDYTTFNETANELMVYAIASGESIHDPGPVTKGLLKDLGWPTTTPDKIGVFRNGTWYLDSSGNGIWEGPLVDYKLFFGLTGDIPVIGNWNPGTGYPTKIGVFRAGRWYLDWNGNDVWNGPVTDKLYSFGSSGSFPVVGDWDGNGTTKIGGFENGWWYLDYNGNGTWDFSVGGDWSFAFGLAGDIPVAGRWSGATSYDCPGVFRAGKWYLDWNCNKVWEGPIIDRVYTFGLAGDKPVAGDWNGGGQTKVGVFRNGKFYLDFNGNGIWEGGSVDRCYTFGLAGDQPVAGKW